MTMAIGSKVGVTLSRVRMTMAIGRQDFQFQKDSG
jgi:hypothetical protein